MSRRGSTNAQVVFPKIDSWEDVLDDFHPNTWAVYELKGKKKYRLTLVATGQGGLDDCRQHIDERKVLFCGFRVLGIGQAGGVRRVRPQFVKCCFTGKCLPKFRKLNVVAVSKKVFGFLTACQLEFHTSDKTDLTPAIIEGKLRETHATQCISYDFGNGTEFCTHKRSSRKLSGPDRLKIGAAIADVNAKVSPGDRWKGVKRKLWSRKFKKSLGKSEPAGTTQFEAEPMISLMQSALDNPIDELKRDALVRISKCEADVGVASTANEIKQSHLISTGSETRGGDGDGGYTSHLADGDGSGYKNSSDGGGDTSHDGGYAAHFVKEDIDDGSSDHFPANNFSDDSKSQLLQFSASELASAGLNAIAATMNMSLTASPAIEDETKSSSVSSLARLSPTQIGASAPKFDNDSNDLICSACRAPQRIIGTCAACQKVAAQTLVIASSFGHIDIVQTLVSGGASVNARTADGNSCLMVALYQGHAPVVKILVDAKANLEATTAEGDTGLSIAALQGMTSVVQIFLAAKANVSHENSDRDSALSMAAAGGFTDIVQLLIGAKASVDRLAKNVTVLLIGAANGHAETVKALAEAKAYVDATTMDKTTPLIIAATNGHANVVDTLIDAKASVNLAAVNGVTGLISAAVGGHKEVATTLLEAKSNLQRAMVDGRTALFMAAANGHLDLARMLLKAGADPSASMVDGCSPLMAASAKGFRDVIFCLLEHGADVDHALTKRNDFLQAEVGATALDISCARLIAEKN